MELKHNDIFKKLINAYYSNSFEETIKEILLKNSISKDELCKVISSLCGVEVENSSDYITNLKNALKNYSAKHKVVDKVRKCTMECIDDAGQTLCQKSCPFNAILIDDENKTTYIDNEKCTDCGICIPACNNGAILDKVEFLPIVDLLKNNKTVIAAVAPSIVGQFGNDVSINKLRAAFKKIGFTDMVEVAFFADMLTIKEACEFDHHVEDKDDFMISSCCCPVWVAMLKKVYKDLVKYVSPSVSPMIAAGRVLKRLNPNCKVVFIGPCVAKKAEAKNEDLIGDIDFVLTFAEVKEIFEALEVDLVNLPEDTSPEYASREGRLYARTGGVSIAVSEAVNNFFPNKHDLLSTVQANGAKECKQILEDILSGKVAGRFIEGMGCPGGCVGGPKRLIPVEEGTECVNTFADNSEIKIGYENLVLRKFLHKLGIYSVEDFKSGNNTEIFERKF